MIAFEHTAKDPKRLFQASFRLVDEDKFRRKAYPTLLNLEEKLLKALEKFEGGMHTTQPAKMRHLCNLSSKDSFVDTNCYVPPLTIFSYNYRAGRDIYV